MTEVYEIGELDRDGVALELTAEERRTLKRMTGEGRRGPLLVEWGSDRSVRIFSRGNVGTVALSADTAISVTTKVPILNILQLASIAYQTHAIPPAHGEALLQPQAEVVDWLAVLLVGEIEVLVDYGLRQDYVVVDDELPYVRGRICFQRNPLARPGLTACEFADFLPDIPENRVLLACLELLATHRLLPGVQGRVEQLLARFHRVELVRLSDQLFADLQTTRLNSHYEPALRLCCLLWDQESLSQRAGDVKAPAYFFPMHQVFERAVTAFLQDHLTDVFSQKGGTYQPIGGHPATSLSFAADIVIGSPPQVVADTKYTRAEIPNQFGGLSFQNKHVYQVAFYALCLGCPGVLIYPRDDRDIDVTFNFEGVEVSLLTIDLTKAGLASFDDLAERLRRIAGERSSLQPLA